MKFSNFFVLLRKMPGVKLLLLIVFFTASHALTGQDYVRAGFKPDQDTRNAGEQKITLRDALKLLTDKFNVQFGFKSDLIKNLYVADLSWKPQATVEQSLQLLLKPFDLKFRKINNRNYVIKKDKEQGIERKTATINSADVFRSESENESSSHYKSKVALAFPVTGTITNDKGEPMAGVSVTVKGTTDGAISDEQGNFTLTVQDENAILVISSMGFISQEVAAGRNRTLNIVLKTSDDSMNEVVVVGYNTQRRADLTGSVASVKTKDIMNLPASSLATALQGRVPGAYISQVDGNPNSSSSIIIRGPLSINGGEPLFVVDGVPFQGTGFNFNNQDIESIDVLKDASAAAIYGYRAAGGVILIRTKKGSSGKIKVGLNSSIGVREVVNLPSTLRRDDYIRAKEAFGFNVVDLYGPSTGWSSLPNTNWLDEMYRPGTEQNHTLFLSGGSDRSNFYVSGNYGKINGTRIGNSIERYTFRVNSDHKIGKRFKVGQTLYANLRNEDPNASTNQGDISFRNTPVMNVYDPTNPVGGWGKSPKGFQGGNDVQGAIGNYTKNEGYEVLLTVNAEAEITKGLILRAVLGTGFNGANNYTYNYRADLGSVQSEETFSKYLSKIQSYIATYTLTYDRSFGDHHIKALAGYEARRSDSSDLSGFNRNPLVPIPQNFNLVQSATSAVLGGSNSGVGDRVLSQFGRIEYSYADKYLLTGTVRRDGLATKFGPNNRYGVFPGVSAGWKISEEKFMQDVRRISYMKLRMGYGLLGNSVGPNFAYSQAYGTGFSYDFGSGERLNSVNIINRLANPDIKWESVATTNIGLDMGFIGDKLLVNLDYYSRQTKDMIYGIGIATSAGLGTTVFANVGQMSNKGFEFNIEYRGNLNKDFSYSVSLNGATNKNRLISLNPLLGRGFLTNGNLSEAHPEDNVSRSEPGRELSNFFGYRVLGIYQDNAAGQKGPTINGGYVPVAGDLIYDDLNKDGEINAEDKAYIGTPWPKLTYGFNLKLGYRGFDFNAFFNGVAGAELYNGFETYQHIFHSDYTTSPKIFETSGFSGGGVTSTPRIGKIDDYDKNLNWASVNSYHVQNASYFRLRNIQLGYNFSSLLLNRLAISSFRLFVMADNLFTITGYKGINPDLGQGSFLERGIDNANYRYPVSRIFSVGVNAEF